MGFLPVVSGKLLLRVLLRNGYVLLKSEGSHHALIHSDRPHIKIIIPVHGRRELKRGTLLNILRSAEITPEQLKNML